MKLKKPKFWNYSKPNLIAYLLLPFSILLQIFKSFQKKEGRNFKIKNICVGNYQKKISNLALLKNTTKIN